MQAVAADGAEGRAAGNEEAGHHDAAAAPVADPVPAEAPQAPVEETWISLIWSDLIFSLLLVLHSRGKGPVCEVIVVFISVSEVIVIDFHRTGGFSVCNQRFLSRLPVRFGPSGFGSKCYAIYCFGTYSTHAQTCDNVRVQSATQWTASVHTQHMPKPVITFVFKVATQWIASVHTLHMPKLYTRLEGRSH